MIDNSYSAYFHHVENVRTSDFFEKFGTHMRERQSVDEKEKDIYNNLQSLEHSDLLSCYSAELTECGIANLILPYHEHESQLAPRGGCTLRQVVSTFQQQQLPDSVKSECIKKILDIHDRFFAKDTLIFEAEFIFVCNSRKYAHDTKFHYGPHHGPNRIYIGNGFHRFAAYGLWMEAHGFRPLKLYFAHIEGAYRIDREDDAHTQNNGSLHL